MSNQHSLLAGRNRAPLTEDQIRRAATTFLGLDSTVNVRFDAQSNTIFHVIADENGDRYGEIVFGRDIYPGASVVDPNSALSLKSACAHELTHYHRWHDLNAIDDPELEHLDDALTSLDAILRFENGLNDNDKRQLVRDAIQRIQLYVGRVTPAAQEVAAEPSNGMATIPLVEQAETAAINEHVISTR